jgi:hypothetical protein
MCANAFTAATTAKIKFDLVNVVHDGKVVSQRTTGDAACHA